MNTLLRERCHRKPYGYGLIFITTDFIEYRCERFAPCQYIPFDFLVWSPPWKYSPFKLLSLQYLYHQAPFANTAQLLSTYLSWSRSLVVNIIPRCFESESPLITKQTNKGLFRKHQNCRIIFNSTRTQCTLIDHNKNVDVVRRWRVHSGFAKTAIGVAGQPRRRRCRDRDAEDVDWKGYGERSPPQLTSGSGGVL